MVPPQSSGAPILMDLVAVFPSSPTSSRARRGSWPAGLVAGAQGEAFHRTLRPMRALLA
jgi:hypothetical protein